MVGYETIWQSALDDIAAQGRLRRLRPVARLSMARIAFAGGSPLLDFASNDYLGLSHHPAMIKAAQEATAQCGTGAGASRLVSGNLSAFAEIEQTLAVAKNMPAALVFVSGVQANLTVLPALLDKQVWGAEPLVYADKLNHASLIQGCLSANVRQIRFRHNDLAHLEELLRRDEAQDRPRFIITESIFSMDGDGPDLQKLSKLADDFKAFLYIDEAHATGVCGAQGFGLAYGLKNALVMGTFSKSMGGFGAYIAGSETLKSYLINRCGGLIYATALPPAVLGAMQSALSLVPQMQDERIHVHNLADILRQRLNQAGFDTGASTTQIIPLILGSEQKALALAEKLEQDGFYTVAIRPPTVPQGTSRLRLTVSALHQEADIHALADAIIRHCS